MGGESVAIRCVRGRQRWSIGRKISTANLMEPKPISELIKETLEHVQTQQLQTLDKVPPERWLREHLKLETNNNPKLKELEDEVGRFCAGIWNHPQVGRLLLLAGANGTGKTHCAKAVQRWVSRVGHAKKYVREPGVIRHVNVILWHWPHLLDTLKNGNWDVVEDMFDVCVLIIDEMGGGHDPSQVGTDKLCQILSRREHMWTLLTTNVPPEDWNEKLDRRIASRLFRNSTLIDLTEVPDFNVP